MNIPGVAAIAAASQAEDHSHGVVSPVVQGRVLHVDGDYLAYFAAGNDDMPAGTSRMVCHDRIERMRLAAGATSVLMHLTADWSDKGQRFSIATVKPYQGNRTGKVKPKNWAMLREYLSSGVVPVKLWEDREADDGLSYAAMRAAHYDGDHTLCVHATTDKDMRMLPGLHLDWKTFGLTEVVPNDYSVIGENGLQYGLKWFALQMLQGDTADHIPGLELYINAKGNPAKVGDATAAKLLADCPDFEDAIYTVASHYEGYYAGSWAERFVEQAALLWLRTDKDARVCNFANYLPLELCSELAPAIAELEERLDTPQSN